MKVNIPENVEVRLEEREFIVKGPKGELRKNFNDPRYNKKVDLKIGNKEITIEPFIKQKKTQAIAGTIRAHVKNMIKGVTDGFEYKMKISSSHFPMTVEQKDSEIIVKNFLGSKHNRIAKIVGDTEVKIEKENISAKGINKEDVAQTCANIENATRVSKWDRRTFIDGIYMVK